VCGRGVLGGAVDVSGIQLTECPERCWKNDWVIDLAVHGTPELAILRVSGRAELVIGGCAENSYRQR
jgi:hypothetical protein